MRANCSWCGKDLGYERKPGDDPDSCGARECEKELRYMAGEEEERMREEAERDHFHRYRY